VQTSERASLVREVWLASLGILVLLGVVKHLAFLPLVAQYGFTVAAGAQLYVPLWLLGRRGIDHDSLGLTWRHWAVDLRIGLIWAGLTAVGFGIGHHFWQVIYRGAHWSPGWPERFFENVLLQVLVVGLAEELYFRGYLQERMTKLWPPKYKLLGAPFGRAIILTSVVFALAHFIGEYNPARLGPFFPSLLFGWLRSRSTTIVSAVFYHAFCNLLSDVLWACYQR